ncbi:MAG: NTP transferase domain-containing protein [Myxococcota bacterium]
MMRAIIIGAGRGRRLAHLTTQIPKPLVPIVGRPMLDHVLAALEEGGGLGRDCVTYICGYKGDVIRERYPDLNFVENPDWPHNNILLSLLYARDELGRGQGFVSTYADIVYRAEAVRAAMDSPYDLTLVVDTDWRRRYVGRTEHPESDAEKVRFDSTGRIGQVSRTIAPDEASGEFIGVFRATATGARTFLDAFDDVRARFADGAPFHEGRTFGKAYLIDLLQKMVEQGVALHAAPIHGGYMEIDTTQDAALAERWWSSNH